MTRRTISPANTLGVTCALVTLVGWSSNEVAVAAPKTFEVKQTAIGTSVASALPSGDAAPAPPQGWELPPPSAPKTSIGTKRASPACCEFDKLCCSRQSEIDRVRRPALRTFSLRFGDISEPTIKEAKKEGPPIDGFPPVRVVDGTGAPFPWLDGPKQFEIRIVPNGMFGFIRFGKDASSGHYGNPNHRSLGYGVTAPITDTPDHGKSLLNGPLEYWMYNPGEGGAIVLDHVKGKLEGSADVVVERWVHTTAINAAEGVVHVYRATYDDKPYVFFLLPEVVTRFESKDALTFGGTGDDRFASDFPYTLYRFPLGPGRSNAATCNLADYEVRRWFDRPKGAMKLPDNLPIMISMSQTSVESEPQIRIMFF
jgi:hypothetical protein